MSDCYCDYGERPDVYAAATHTARKRYRCYECHGAILPRERYERAAMLFAGSWEIARTCARCLSVREYVKAHASCFCWLHGNMLEEARSTIEEHGGESAGFWIGGMKRLLRAERHKAAP